MSNAELDALILQINNSYRDSWEQARLVASAFGGGEGLVFPWDNDNTKHKYTQAEFEESYNQFFQHIEK
jgi:hypothetical protein